MPGRMLARLDRVIKRHNRNGRGPCGCHRCENEPALTNGIRRRRERRAWQKHEAA